MVGHYIPRWYLKQWGVESGEHQEKIIAADKWPTGSSKYPAVRWTKPGSMAKEKNFYDEYEGDVTRMEEKIKGSIEALIRKDGVKCADEVMDILAWAAFLSAQNPRFRRERRQLAGEYGRQLMIDKISSEEGFREVRDRATKMGFIPMTDKKTQAEVIEELSESTEDGDLSNKGMTEAGLGVAINRMCLLTVRKWVVLRIWQPGVEFITSDNPVSGYATHENEALIDRTGPYTFPVEENSVVTLPLAPRWALAGVIVDDMNDVISSAAQRADLLMCNDTVAARVNTSSWGGAERFIFSRRTRFPIVNAQGEVRPAIVEPAVGRPSGR